MMLGFNITQPNDPLQKTTVEHLVKFIAQPPTQFLEKIEILRKLKLTDINSYKAQKKQLPYFVTSIFHPPHRKIEHFAAIYYFVIDLDNLHTIDKDTNELKNLLSKDPLITAIFISPGQDGLKLLFKLNKPCKDPHAYKSFYKNFILSFAKQYNLLQVVDIRTNDVTRATFLSYDPNIFFNPNAHQIEMQNYMNLNLEENEITYHNTISSHTDSFQNISDKNDLDNTNKKDIDQHTLIKIKEILGNKIKKKNVDHPPDDTLLPQKLKETFPLLIEKMKEDNIILLHHRPINYGIQARFKMDNLVAEVNIFYGKKGFSIVPVLKKDTNLKFTQHLKELIKFLLDELSII